MLALPLSISIAYGLSKPIATKLKLFFNYFGKISLELYLVHIFVLNYACVYLNGVVSFLFVFFAFSIAISLLLHFFCDRLISSIL